MVLLRIVGFLAALALLAMGVRGYRRRVLGLPDASIVVVLALCLGGLSLAPFAVDPLLRNLGFPPGGGRRVLGVLVISNLITYLLLFRSLAKIDVAEATTGELSDRIAARAFLDRYGRGGRAPGSAGKLVVVIPALNEEKSLPGVLADIPERVAALDVEVIVVSDGSTDSTEEVAASHGALVAGRDLRRGQGAAVVLGYRLALERGADVVATLDADGQYDPKELPDLIAPILEGEAEVTHGSRVLGHYEQPLPGRSVGVKVFAWITSLLTGVRITDPASGFRAFSPHALRILSFKENQFHASEVTVGAVKRGLRVKEVPCTFRERSAGTTKKPPLLEYGLGYARTLMRTWLR
jgi:hypothetical protein